MKKREAIASEEYRGDNHYPIKGRSEKGHRPGPGIPGRGQGTATGGHDLSRKGDLSNVAATCPFRNVRTELCTAALSSSMIDGKHCSNRGYEKCPIFLVNKSKEA